MVNPLQKIDNLYIVTFWLFYALREGSAIFSIEKHKNETEFIIISVAFYVHEYEETSKYKQPTVITEYS